MFILDSSVGQLTNQLAQSGGNAVDQTLSGNTESAINSNIQAKLAEDALKEKIKVIKAQLSIVEESRGLLA